MALWVPRARLTPRKITILVIVTILLILIRKCIEGFGSEANNSHNPVPPETVFKARREFFDNSLYHNMPEAKDIDHNCVNYLNRIPRAFKNLKLIRSGLNQAGSFEQLHRSNGLDWQLYNQKTWLKRQKIETKKRIAKKNIKYGPEIEKQDHQMFAEMTFLLSNLEHETTFNTSNARIFGVCMVEGSITKMTKLCSKLEKQIYPWITGKAPEVEDMEGKVLKRTPFKCFFQESIASSKGTGIVIPILPDTSVDNLQRLLRLLRRVTKSTNLVEIIHAGTLSLDDKHKLVAAARNDRKPVDGVDDGSTFIPLEILFVNVKDSVKFDMNAHGNRMYILAHVFNSFEDAIVMTDKTIPMMDSFDKYLLGLESYKHRGAYFFKNRSDLSLKVYQIPDGFYPVTELIKYNLMPTENDRKYFKILGRDHERSGSNRLFEDNFQKLLDPSMTVVNKKKALSGLLLGVNMLDYEILGIRLRDNIWAEAAWLGQEMVGSSDIVNFNSFHAVSLGILTPNGRKPEELVTASDELCSSSWGQICDEDERQLIYVTSHQADNWQSSMFRESVMYKYSIRDDDKRPSEETKLANRQILENLQKNPYSIGTVMIPATLSKLEKDEEYVEPGEAWIEQSNFADGHPYWCSYNIVGHPFTEFQGTIINYSEEEKNWNNYVTGMWMEPLEWI